MAGFVTQSSDVESRLPHHTKGKVHKEVMAAASICENQTKLVIRKELEISGSIDSTQPSCGGVSSWRWTLEKGKDMAPQVASCNYRLRSHAGHDNTFL